MSLNLLWQSMRVGLLINASALILGCTAIRSPVTQNAIAVNTPNIEQLVFSAAPGYRGGDIYSINADGSKLTQLTHTGHDRQPTWSPNGEQIAFLSERALSGYQLFLMNKDGSQPQEIARWNEGPLEVHWSPTGTALAVEVGQTAPLLLNLEGKELWRGPYPNYGDSHWSNNGDYIAISQRRRDDVPSSIVILRVRDGFQMAEITQVPENCYVHSGNGEPSWSPDDKILVFNSCGRVATVSPMGGEPKILTDYGDTYAFTPTWSHDGKKIAYVRWADKNYDIYVINPDGSELAQLTQDTAMKSCPVWSSDSQQIAFRSHRDNDKGEIYVMNADGTNQKRLTNNDMYESCPQ